MMDVAERREAVLNQIQVENTEETRMFDNGGNLVAPA